MTKFPQPLARLALLAGLPAWLATACGEPTGPELTQPCVSWCNSVAPWPHDGNPYTSGNFTVYSDGARREALVELAEIAERVLADLIDRFEIASTTRFVFPPGQDRIHLYAYKYHYQAEWGGQSFWGGLLIFSLDHPRLTELTERGHYTRLMTHEMTHVLQNLLVGSTHSYSTHTWFEEGLAELVSEVDWERSIRTRAEFEQRIAQFGELNPIAIRDDILPPIENVGTHYFYPMFELTMRYLLDPQGLGRTLPDARDVFLDMREGTSFVAAFETAFGVPVAELEDEFFVRMREYLP